MTINVWWVKMKVHFVKFYYNRRGLRTSPLERGGWRQGARRVCLTPTISPHPLNPPLLKERGGL